MQGGKKPNPAEMTDDELLESIDRNRNQSEAPGALSDPSAEWRALVEELVARNYLWLTRFCLFETSDKELARECVQEVMLQLITSIGSFRRQAALKTWLYVVARRTTRRVRRKRWLWDDVFGKKIKNGEENGEETIARQPTSEILLEVSERSRAVLSLVRKLPDAQRQAVFFHYFEDLPVDEVAGRLDCSVSSAKTHLRRARFKLRGWIEQGDEELRALLGKSNGI